MIAAELHLHARRTRSSQWRPGSLEGNMRIGALRLGAIPLTLLLVSACGSGIATFPPVPGTAGPTTATTAVDTAGATAAETAAATPGPGETASPTPPYLPPPPPPPTDASTAAPAGRSAWSSGQTIKGWKLVGPGVGWVYTNSGVWETDDDGATWANATPARLIVSKIRGFAAIDGSNALMALGDVGATTTTYYIWRTRNAGHTWTYVSLPPMEHDTSCAGCSPPAPSDPTASIEFVDTNTAFVVITMHRGFDGYQNYIYGTSNGGGSWTRLTWTPALMPDGAGPELQVHFASASVGVVTSTDVIASTTSGWGHWNERRLPTDRFGVWDVQFLPGAWYINQSIEEGTYHYWYAVSTNNGLTWVDHSTNVPGFSGTSGARVRFLSATEWIGTEMTYSGTLPNEGPARTIYTSDGGVHWVQYGLQPLNGPAAAFVDSNHGWIGPDLFYPGTRLYTTSDRGLHWRQITS
jgi:hypothetical protein